MSETEVPPAKRMKVELEDEEDTDDNIANEDETTSNKGKSNMKRKLVINPVSTFDGMGPDESSSKASTSYNHVTLEDLQKLREFQVLDEVNDEDSKGEDSDSSGKSDGELPDEEIEKMLEEDLPEGFKGVPKPKEKSYITRQKIVLEEKGINHFEVLPLDWMMVRHWSGMPVYMHRGTRVCTLSKPYFLGKGNTRRHDIPISAIPCLAYRKALEEEEKQKEIDKSIAEQIQSGSWANNSTQTKQTDKDIDTNNSINQDLQNSDYTEDITIGEKEFTSDRQSQPEVAIVDTSTTVEKPKETSSQPSESILINSDLTNDDCEVLNDTTQNSVQPGNESTQNSDQPGNESTQTEVPGNDSCQSSDQPGSESVQNSYRPGCPFKDAPSRKPVVLPGGIVMPPPRVETVNTSWKTQHLSHEQVNDYCKKLFKFKTVNIMHFKRWADRRKYVKVRKTLQYPTLPEGTKLITIPAQTNGQENGGKATKRDWVMNMNGCSYLSVFHEYVRRALQKQPVYEFKQVENAATPYQATVYIGGMQYGVGHGSSKRQAKSAAARTSIHILIPEMKEELDEHARQNPTQESNGEPDFSFFDYVGIEDPRIQEFCAATSEPSPHAILRTCLLRNFGAGDRHIHTEMKKLEYQKIELTMKVGKHSATVVCKNKKQAKQRASQAILQALHPHVRSWGSLLRLYGSRSVKSCKEKKLEEQQITLLQDKAQQNEPNYAVLEKLRNEMRKLKERDEAVVPIGTLLVADDLPTHSGSMLNNVDL